MDALLADEHPPLFLYLYPAGGSNPGDCLTTRQAAGICASRSDKFFLAIIPSAFHVVRRFSRAELHMQADLMGNRHSKDQGKGGEMLKNVCC